MILEDEGTGGTKDSGMENLGTMKLEMTSLF